MKVNELNNIFPLSCDAVQKIRGDYAHWHFNVYKQGYIRYNLGWKDEHYEHRLVAEYDYGPIPPGYNVHHLNENKTDNRAVNLQVLSPSEHAALHLGERVSAVCPVCTKPIRVKACQFERAKQNYCSTICRGLADRKVVRPSAEKLRRLLADIGNWSAIGRMYGVSDNAVRKWAKRYQLDISGIDGRLR